MKEKFGQKKEERQGNLANLAHYDLNLFIETPIATSILLYFPNKLLFLNCKEILSEKMGCCSDSSSPSSNTTIDKEIDACLSTLRALQYSLKASSHDRRRGGNANNNNDSFAGMKSVIIQRLTTVRNLMDAAPQMGAGGESDLNTDSKAIVSHQVRNCVPNSCFKTRRTKVN